MRILECNLDGIVGVYRDLKEGLVSLARGTATAEEGIWEWRLGFYSHWDHQAISALKTIHRILNY